LEFEIIEAFISATTGIPIIGERWFKSMALSSAYAKDPFKPKYQVNDLSKSMPRHQLIKLFHRLLKIIQRYFTCERRFNTLYQYHIRLLLHFIKVEMNVPYYLRYRKCSQIISWINQNSLEELSKKEMSWEHFVVTSHFKLDLAPTPQSQKASPLSPTSTSKEGTSRKRKGRTPIQVPDINK
jgi:hypothetical protein